MATYSEKLDDLIETFEWVDRGDRIQLLIDISDRFVDVDPDVAQRPFGEAHKVPACESEAYVWAEPVDEDRLNFHFAVENPQGLSAKAMAVILGESLSGQPVADYVGLPGEVVYKIFGNELSMGKSMGLMGMVSMVTHFAKKHASAQAVGQTSANSSEMD